MSRPGHATEGRKSSGSQTFFPANLTRKLATGPGPQPLPRITVVTPVRNAEATIRETIESVLSQNYPDLEYIVVDGASTDGTLDVVHEYEDHITRIISEPDKGMYDAVGKGFDLGTGEILAYLNADDLYEPGGLLRVGEYFRDHPRAQVIYHEDIVQVNGWRFPNRKRRQWDFFDVLRGRYHLYQDGVFFRRKAYQGVGGISRHMKLAGDYELWTRLSYRHPLHRVDGHVSCFRIRAGQLSSHWTDYWWELNLARQGMKATVGKLGRLRRVPRWLINRGRNIWAHFFQPRTLFFPLNRTHENPPPGKAPPPPIDVRSPLLGRSPDRLLFSTRDTRFGDDHIHYVYYDAHSHLAFAYPILPPEVLNGLYETHYTNPDGKVHEPRPDHGSPYRNHRGGGWGGWLARNFHLIRPLRDRLAGAVDWRWVEQTADILLHNLFDRVPAHGKKPRFLDVGCYEGLLLDELAKRTDWQLSGLEVNPKVVEVARAKGHTIWEADAEHAADVVPPGSRFDVIFLSQVIEHLQDPVTVVRSLETLLAPGGLLVLSTPNLDSKQIEMFGPTWAHWHLPYHRMIFSARSLRLLADLATLDVVRMQTYSHPGWTALSLLHNRLGLGGSAPHNTPFAADLVRKANSVTAWMQMLWNKRGKGDYLVAVLAKRA